jgi:hypothetical protein
LQTSPRWMIKHSKQLWTLTNRMHSVLRMEACKWTHRKTHSLLPDSSKEEWIATKIWCQVPVMDSDLKSMTTPKKNKSCSRTLKKQTKIRREHSTKNTSRNQKWKGKERRRHSCNCRNGKVRETEKQLERSHWIRKRQIWNSRNFLKQNLETTLGSVL